MLKRKQLSEEERYMYIPWWEIAIEALAFIVICIVLPYSLAFAMVIAG